MNPERLKALVEKLSPEDKEALAMTPAEVRAAVKRKRAAEAKAARGGRGGRGARAPVRVATYRGNPDVTSTQAFRRWFGDSKVVDENGEPLVVYHGTNKSFDVFNTRSKSVNSTTFGDVETERSGIFVSDNPEFSREFGSRLLSLYARIENLAEVNRDTALDFAETIDAFTERDLWLLARNISRPWMLFDGELGPRFIAYLQELGHDGATFIEDVPKGDDVGEDEQEYVEGRTYVAFYPEQLKLADGTNTTFDPTNPDVRANPYDPEEDVFGPVVRVDELEDGTVVEYVEVPFPVERKPLAYRDDPKVQGLVNLDTLIATQRHVSKAGVEQYLGDDDRSPPRPGTARMPALLVLETSDGRQYIADGHHRAFAAYLRDIAQFPAIIQFVRE